MARILLAALLFGFLIYWVFASSTTGRPGLNRRHYRALASLLLLFELIVAAIVFIRVPLVRTLPGALIAIPLFYTAHTMIARGMLEFFRNRGWLRGAGDPKTIDITGRPSDRTSLFARHFYLILAAAYLMTVGLVLVIQRIIAE